MSTASTPSAAAPAGLPRPCSAPGTILFGRSAALLAVLLALTTVGCREGGSAAVPKADTQEEPLLIDPVLLLGLDEEETAPVQPDNPHPILPFREHSGGLPESGTWLGQPRLYDFDGDGRLDLVASNREEDGVATWRFRPGESWERSIEGLPRTMSYGPTHAFDLDGDGKLDLFVGDHVEGLRGFLGDGALGWKESTRSWPRPNLIIDIASGDLDGDGVTDVVTLGHFKGGLDIYLGDGKGGLVHYAGGRRLLEPKRFGRRLELADFDGDGRLDIAVASDHGLKVFFAIEGGELTWEERSEGLPVPTIGNSLYGLAAARFDESRPLPQLAAGIVGDPGMLPEERRNVGIYGYDLEKKRWSAIDRGLDNEDSYRDLAAADFDGDGHQDLLVSTIHSGRLFYLGDGKGGFRAVGRIEGHGKTRLAVGDIDGDGLVDVVIATAGQKGSQVPGSIRCFLNQRSLWR